MLRTYNFYIIDYNKDEEFKFYKKCDTLIEANETIEELTKKGYNTWSKTETFGWEWTTEDYTLPVTQYYFAKPLMLIKEETETFDELVQTGKSFREINKIIKEREEL